MDVVANGARFHVQDLGAGPRPPVVMLHGLLVGSLAAWYFTAAPALAEQRRVRLFDLRGHGRTERVREGYDVATMARDLAELAAPLGDGPIDLVGHSFGALVALRFALDHKGSVRRLVLVEAPLPPSRFDELSDFAARSPAQMIEALPADLRAFLAGGGRKASRLLESIRFLAEDSTMLRDLAAEPDIPDADLARLSCPTLAVYGAASSCRAVGDRLSRALPNGTLRVLLGGHYLHLDATAALTTAILEFLDAPDTTVAPGATSTRAAAQSTEARDGGR
ncbi:MAG: alpha/beta hydrolase [Polyangiaceae bacterium]